MGKWEMAVFDDVLTIINGKNQRQVENPSGKYPIYGSGGVMGYADDYLCEAKTVVIGRKGTINRPIFVEEPFWNVDTAFGLRAKNVLNPKYLFYFCEQFDFEALNTTVTIPSLTKVNLLKIRISLPPLPVQQKIADVLDRASALIEKRKAQIDKLDLLVKSQFIEMFGDPVTNSMGWEMFEINGICNTIVDCPHSTPNYVSDNTGYACLRTSVLKNYQIDWDKVEYINACQYTERTKRYVPQQNDIVYSREGAILGIAAVINKKREIALGQRMMLFSVDSKQCHFLYLWFILNLQGVAQQVQDKIGGSASPHINVKDIKVFKIPLPPLQAQNQFAAFVQQVEAQKERIKKNLDLLELNYKSLMQKYFRGDVFK